MKTPHRSRARARARAAVMVEAIIVISFSTICFLGILYFRELYEMQLRSQRLARAGALAHAMSACKADPAAGLEKDLPKKKLDKSDVTPSPDGIPQGDGRDKGAFDTIAQQRGGTVFSRVTSVTVGREVEVSTRNDPASKPWGFKGQARSTSYVACADPMHPHDDTMQGFVSFVGGLF